VQSGDYKSRIGGKFRRDGSKSKTRNASKSTSRRRKLKSATRRRGGRVVKLSEIEKMAVRVERLERGEKPEKVKLQEILGTATLRIGTFIFTWLNGGGEAAGNAGESYAPYRDITFRVAEWLSGYLAQ
jgi:hypothetical protein